MSLPVTKPVRIGQAVGAVICVAMVAYLTPVIAATSGGYSLETQQMVPDTGYGFVCACLATLPVLMAMWFFGYASKNRDDQAKVDRAWWIMMALVWAFHMWTAHETNKQQAEMQQKRDNADRAQAQAQANADFMRQWNA
jgi:Ca2+/H+ antiporter